MPYNTILFDFDYTLADATPGIVASANHALCAMGLAECAVDAIRRTVGMPITDAYAYLTSDADAAHAKQYEQLYLAKADEVMTPSTTLFADTIATLQTLRAHSCRIGIVTSKMRYRIDEALSMHGVEALVDYVVGFEDVYKPKPAPEGLFKAIAHFDATKEQTLYVGDSLYDANAAANAALDFAAVLNGTTTRADLSSLPHVLIAESLTEIVDFALQK